MMQPPAMLSITYSKHALKSLAGLPFPIRAAFYKQVALLAANLQHPSRHAKKYDESYDVWQARVNRSWRFYFSITDGTCQIEDVIPHEIASPQYSTTNNSRKKPSHSTAQLPVPTLEVENSSLAARV